MHGARLSWSCSSMRRVGSGGLGCPRRERQRWHLRKAKKLADAPKRVWRRETLHTLEGRVSPCPNMVRRGGQPERAARNDIPLEAREMRVHVTAVTVGRHRSYSSWRTAPRSASAGTRAGSEHQPEGSVCRHHGRCLHVERRRKGERGELEITKTIWKASLTDRRLFVETARWNTLEVLLGPRLTRALVVRPSVSGKWAGFLRPRSRKRRWSTGDSGPRVGEDGSPGVPRDDNRVVRGWDDLGNGRSSSRQAGAVGQHPRRWKGVRWVVHQGSLSPKQAQANSGASLSPPTSRKGGGESSNRAERKVRASCT